MGQVSILEDIQKAIENLEHELTRSTPPTEVAIASQQKRLEKERVRLNELALSLLVLARELRSGLNKQSMKNVSAVLQLQVSQRRIDTIKHELARIEGRLQKAKATDARLNAVMAEQTLLDAKISALTEGFSHVGVSKENRKNIIKELLDQKLSTLVKNHTNTKTMKVELASMRAERDQALAERDILRVRLEEAKAMLRQHASKRLEG